jgi:thioredoxin 1
MLENIFYNTDENFSELIKNGYSLIDFYADWCGPCRMMNPIIEKIAATYNGKLKVIKCDVDKCTETANKFKVQGIPMLLIAKDGSILASKVGACSESALLDFIEENIKH